MAENRPPNPKQKRRPVPNTVSDTLNTQPPKISFSNVVDPKDTIFPQYNPNKLREQIKVQWSKITVPGLSHKRVNYISTENTGFKMKLHYDATGRTPDVREKFLDHRKFFQAHAVPRGGADTVLGGEAPRLLFIWPGLISMTCILESADFDYTRFNSELGLLTWDVDLVLSEIRDVRLTFEEVRAQGTQRRGSPSSALSAIETDPTSVLV